ncbi:YicC/YloC family endoribonuclease [Rhodobaculum claviforme]|uniref:YicC family protein n=1 Tax=Rhodobaculum claviforme TaxID=1549854 RepID=A0A934WJR9_9RHOB|nr:YicC/YloC family endoribonuclease [Rhodobaculum claviforme]MBK5928336.1 YicC family protein [Rhodobaculum claviforme]
MISSMTGFATHAGALDRVSWQWEMRSVNARGLDLRLRLPDGIAGLEAGVRAALSARIARGSVSLSLRLTRPAEGEVPRLNAEVLSAVLSALRTAEEAAAAADVRLAPASAAEVLALRGVLETAAPEADTAPLAAALLADLPALLDAHGAARAAEGAALGAILAAQVDRIAALSEAAAELAAARRPEQARALASAVAALLAQAPQADPGRLEQELAVIATRTDITEEIDRLRAHVAAARDLLGQGGPVGRRLDFLTQEFNREANTLCAKAQSAALTRAGLDLKAVIDQMREQVQNVE